jgi:hypothetical protein
MARRTSWRGQRRRGLIRFPGEPFTQAASGHQWKRVEALMASGWSQSARQRSARAASSAAKLDRTCESGTVYCHKVLGRGLSTGISMQR